MNSSLTPEKAGPPLWLLAELTYRCPLQCPYCSNPLDLQKESAELSTADWIRVFEQSREMGAAQLGFSGGEPLVRQDLIELIRKGRELGYYSNLITSGIGLSEHKIADFREAGLDHIQVSFQASNEELNNWIAGSKKAFAQKLAMAREVKAQNYPMVLNFVTHRHNIDQIDKIIELCIELKADFVELATCKHYGWAWENRDQLLPSREQMERAEAVTNRYREQLAAEGNPMRLIFVTPDYYEDYPVACMSGLGRVFLTVTPDGTALPCHSARILPMQFPNVKDFSIEDIWQRAESFNHFRGDDWMQEPCKSCDRRAEDRGGCRCQAFMMTGDMHATDPLCIKSPHHDQILEAQKIADQPVEALEKPLVFRNMKNAEAFIPK